MKLGLSHEEVMKMLDKTELEATLARLTQHKARMEMYKEIESYWQEQLTLITGFCVENVYTIVVGLVVLLFIIFVPKNYITEFHIHVYDYFTGYIFPIKSKVKAIRKAWKYKLKYSFCCLVMAMMIELYEMAIHITMPLGWILPYSSPLRQFFPSTLYIPMSMKMIKNDLPSYGMNIGPQITVMACRYIRGKFENFGAKDIMEYRERRRAGGVDEGVQ